MLGGEKVILVLSDLWLPFPGGAERLMFNVARFLAYTHDVAVLTGYEPAKPFDGPHVHYEPIGVFDSREQGAQIVTDYIATFTPSLILTHHLYAYQFEPELEASDIPVVQLVLNHRRLPCATLAVYISEWVRQQTGDAQPDDIVITPPAFTDVIADRHGDRIGFIKPIPHKGVDLIYEIARAMPERQFVILRGEWQTLETIERLPNVLFMDPVDDIADFYAECRLVLMPSISEDAGTVAQECALNGIPCISSNIGGLRETNAGGVRITTRDPAQWAHHIRELDDPTRYNQCVESQTAQIESTYQMYRMTNLVDRIDDIIAMGGENR